MYIGGPGLRRNMRLLRRNTAVLGRNTAVHVLRRNMRLLRGNTAVLRGSLTPPPRPQISPLKFIMLLVPVGEKIRLKYRYHIAFVKSCILNYQTV